jgi:hypothetical protein
MRCLSMRCPPLEVHAYEVSALEVHDHEMPTYEVPAHEVPTLTRPRPPPSRSTNPLRLRGSISGPWSARPPWTPTADGRLTLIITSERSLPPSRLLFSFSCYLAASLLLAGSFVFSSASTPALFCVDTLHFSLVLYPLYFTVAPALSFLFLSFPSRWVENAPLRITIEQQRRMAGYRGAMKRWIVYSRRRTSLRTDTNRTSRRPRSVDNVGARLRRLTQGVSALFPPQNADQIHEVSCRGRASLPQSACRSTAPPLATYS